jgi:hypothetical protein
MSKYKPFWSKFVKYDHPYLQQCNISDWLTIIWQITRCVHMSAGSKSSPRTTTV